MPDTTWPQVAVEDAAALVELAELGDEAAGALKPGMRPREFVLALREAERDADAIKALAHALPAREAVWWACRCLRAVNAPAPDSHGAAALDLAEQWAREPGDQRGREAYAIAQELGFGVPEAWAATAAHWAGSNMNPNPDLPPVPPPPGLVGKAVSGAIGLSAVADDPPVPAERHKQFFDIGLAVAAGKDSWKQQVG